MLKNLCGKNTPSMESGKQQRTIRIKAMNGTCGQQQSQTAAWGDEAHVLFGQGARPWQDTGRENRGRPAEYLPYLFILRLTLSSLIHSVSHFSLCQLSSSMANVQGVADIQENTMHCSWTTRKQINKTTPSTIWQRVRMQHISVFISGVFMTFSRRLQSDLFTVHSLFFSSRFHLNQLTESVHSFSQTNQTLPQPVWANRVVAIEMVLFLCSCHFSVRTIWPPSTCAQFPSNPAAHGSLHWAYL